MKRKWKKRKKNRFASAFAWLFRWQTQFALVWQWQWRLTDLTKSNHWMHSHWKSKIWSIYTNTQYKYTQYNIFNILYLKGSPFIAVRFIMSTDCIYISRWNVSFVDRKYKHLFPACFFFAFISIEIFFYPNILFFLLFSFSVFFCSSFSLLFSFHHFSFYCYADVCCYSISLASSLPILYFPFSFSER